MTEKFLTVRDVSLILAISEKEVMDLVESKQLDAYRVGGVYIRFKQEQIAGFRKSFKPASKHKIIASHKYVLKDRISDFFYFNDFYLLSVLIIALILVIIFQGP
mgnify:CR=1 FL=1